MNQSLNQLENQIIDQRPQSQSATLRISEIFYSVQGESRSVGWPTVFVRLTGCPLRCDYCDTQYAFQGGETMTLDAIVDQVKTYQPRYVTVTGGEPLAQAAGCRRLLTTLCQAGYQVSLETSGALDIADIDPGVMIVMDLKTPASGELARNRMANIELLRPQDQLKFVICDEADYHWARELIQSQQLNEKTEVLMSPAFGRLEPTRLAEWILADRLDVRLQVQLHKILWGDEAGR